MFALCIESSHQRGMGHLFRMLRFASFLRKKGERLLFLLNDHVPAIKLLRENNFNYKIVPIDDVNSNWELELIQKNAIKVWVNDRLNTSDKHALNVKKSNIKLVTLDDRGDGASFSDLNVAGLIFDQLQELKGNKVLTGAKYLIVDTEINRFRRLRTELKKVLVSMGGSDTYGVSIQIIEMLKNSVLPVTVIVGPGFENMDRLKQVLPQHFILKVNVPSLIESFAEFDLAFTAGGVTPFEACASGLPCVVIATERFEIPVGQYLESIGACIYEGYYKDVKSLTETSSLDIEKMSKQAMLHIDSRGAERVYEEITKI